LTIPSSGQRSRTAKRTLERMEWAVLRKARRLLLSRLVMERKRENIENKYGEKDDKNNAGTVLPKGDGDCRRGLCPLSQVGRKVRAKDTALLSHPLHHLGWPSEAEREKGRSLTEGITLGYCTVHRS
jgi:hypothetical protein